MKSVTLVFLGALLLPRWATQTLAELGRFRL